MKVLVTGGAGFIGSAVCRHLAADLGWQAVAVDKLTYAGHLSSLAAVASHPNFTFVRADVADRSAMDGVLASHAPDAVMHLAAETHVDRSIDAPPQFIQTNIVGTAVLLEAARGYFERLAPPKRASFRFLHVSTDEIYGSLAATGAFDETTPADPRSPYSASKAAADHLVSAWGHTYAMPVLISNCSNNFGPYQLCEKLIPLAILNALEGLPIPLYGDGMNIRDWLFVEDHVRALVAILTKGAPGERYNVGARCERTNLGIVETICDSVDRRAGARDRRKLIEFVADRPGHDRRYAIDPSRIERELGWRPRAGFEDALEKTVGWYLDNRAWWLPLRQAGHGKTRLGLAPATGGAAH